MKSRSLGLLSLFQYYHILLLSSNLPLCQFDHSCCCRSSSHYPRLLFGQFGIGKNDFIFTFFSSSHRSIDILCLSFNSRLDVPKCKIKCMKRRLSSPSPIIQLNSDDLELTFYQFDRQHIPAVVDTFSVPLPQMVKMPSKMPSQLLPSQISSQLVSSPFFSHDELSDLTQRELKYLWTSRGCLPDAYHHEISVCCLSGGSLIIH